MELVLSHLLVDVPYSLWCQHLQSFRSIIFSVTEYQSLRSFYDPKGSTPILQRKMRRIDLFCLAWNRSRSILLPVGKQTQKPTEEIIEAIRLGQDADANYKRLFDRYGQQLYRFYMKKGLSPEDSRDLTQEAFISAFNGLGELREPHKFRHWLFKIARNVYINHVEQKQAKKRDAREVSLETGQDKSRRQSEEEWRISELSPDPLNTVLEEEKRSELRDAVNNLPTQMRRCVYMRIAKGMPNSEIAEALGISIHTVKAHLQQAKRILKEKLRRHLTVLI